MPSFLDYIGKGGPPFILQNHAPLTDDERRQNAEYHRKRIAAENLERKKKSDEIRRQMAERVLEKILYAILSLTKKTRREYVNIISIDGIPVVPQLLDTDQRAQLDASGINYEIMGRRRGARRRVAVDDQVYQNLQAPAPAQNIRVIEIPEDYDFDAPNKKRS